MLELIRNGTETARILDQRGPLRTRMIDELTLGRSPVAIWADLVAEGAQRICVETIYAAVFSRALGLKGTKCLHSRQPRRRGRQTRHTGKRLGITTIASRRTREQSQRTGPLGS